MSKEENPNIQAVALMLDIAESIMKNRRGNASKLSESKIVDIAGKFANAISFELDIICGGE